MLEGFLVLICSLFITALFLFFAIAIVVAVVAIIFNMFVSMTRHWILTLIFLFIVYGLWEKGQLQLMYINLFGL